MPSPAEFKAPFCCGDFYHLVFKSIGDTLLFKEPDNRPFFLDKFSTFLSPVLNCWTYCLPDNHAHFIVRIKTQQLLQQAIEELPDKTRTIAMKKFLADSANPCIVDELIERQVNRFMVSYTNSYNSVFSRQGGLFQSPFRRSLIDGDMHLQQAIIYVHANAQKHGLHADYSSYLYSSYQEIIAGQSSLIDIPALLHFFEGRDNFIKLHKEQVLHFYKSD